MLGTPISVLGGWPTVSGGFSRQHIDKFFSLITTGRPIGAYGFATCTAFLRPSVPYTIHKLLSIMRLCYALERDGFIVARQRGPLGSRSFVLPATALPAAVAWSSMKVPQTGSSDSFTNVSIEAP
jgi:hypothetical protein